MKQTDYQNLTPDLILDAIESFDIQAESALLALNSYENRVFQFRNEEQVRFVAKFYRPGRWTDAAIKEEHEFCWQLVEAELPIVAPLRNENGETLFHWQGYRFSIYPNKGGRALELENLDNLSWMGRFIARIHNISALQTFEHRPKINVKTYGWDNYHYLSNCELVPPHLLESYTTIARQVLESCDSLFSKTGELSEIRLHGDCHPSNILWTEQGPHFVDFDDCRTGPAIQDLWMMLSGDDMEMRLQLDAILSGYEEFRELDYLEVNLIEALRSLRMIHYTTWLARRWNDPAFPRYFPWFDSDKYWEEQILALKEQLAATQQPPVLLPSQY